MNSNTNTLPVGDSPITPSQATTPIDGLTMLTGKPYTNAAQTDIAKTWRRFGWTPPSEAKAQLAEGIEVREYRPYMAG